MKKCQYQARKIFKNFEYKEVFKGVVKEIYVFSDYINKFIDRLTRGEYKKLLIFR